VTPSPIAGPGYLDELDLKSATFTVVGYGTDAYITGSAASPQAITVYDGVRSYRDVTAIPARDAFPDRFIKITKSVCFGDSGGPLFHEGTIVGLNAWTFSCRCDGPTSSTGSTRSRRRSSSRRTCSGRARSGHDDELSTGAGAAPQLRHRAAAGGRPGPRAVARSAYGTAVGGSVLERAPPTAVRQRQLPLKGTRGGV
jgi:hypothetical protein